MPTRKEVLAYYRGFEEALRLHAYTCPGEGNLLWVGTPQGPGKLLRNALEEMKEAKKLALQEAEKPEAPKFAIVAGEPNIRGVVTAEVRSFTDPKVTYRLAYHSVMDSVHCSCESFAHKNRWNAQVFPKSTDTDLLCKHALEFLPQLIKSAEEGK